MSIQLLALIIAVCATASVFFANPRRRINQAFTVVSLWIAIWFFLLWVVTRPDAGDPVPWLKAISAFGAFLPWLLWWIGQCAIEPDTQWREFILKGKYWFVFAAAMALIASSNWFIPAESTPKHPMRGVGYTVYVVGIIGSYLFLVAHASYKTRRLTGIHLVELKILLVGGAISALVGASLTTLPPLLGIPSLASFSPMAVLLFYALTAWGITSRRIFDAQQLFFSVARRLLALVTASALLSFWLDHAESRLPAGVAMLVGMFACVSLVMIIEQRTKDSLFSSRARLAEQVRTTVLSSGRDETDPDSLMARYSDILGKWAHTSLVEIRSASDARDRWNLNAESSGMRLLLDERWATPESLSRRRITPAVEELDRFMTRKKFGVVVLSPQARDTPPIAIALGRREDGMPFLWPDIQNLLEWSELIEVALSRAQLVKRARETEQVATAGLLGASLAHEIRNPLVALKTFAQLLPERHQDPEFRVEFSQVFQKEVARIESLTEQLLKLSSPRKPVMRTVRLNEIVLDCTTLMRPKFAESHIELHVDLTADERPISADAGSVNQIILNLLVNAQQALAGQPGQRVVNVRTRLGAREITLEVADNGPGVAPEQRERLFQPFSSGKINGFGLGLAMSANIMRGHRGSIALVETGQPGATFRLTFPCPPS